MPILPEGSDVPPPTPVGPFPPAISRPVRWRALLLPKGALGAWAVTLIWVLPQLFLLLVNLSAWDLASGEMNPEQRRAAYAIFASGMVLLLTGVGFAAWLGWRRISFPRLLGLVPLLLSAIYLTVVMFQVGSAIPATLADWMLPPFQWMLKQFALVMPAALYGAFRLLCPEDDGREETGRHFLISLGISLGLLVGSLGSIFAFAWISAHLLRFWNIGAVHGAIVCGLFLSVSIFASASLLRVCLSVYVWARQRSGILLTGLTALVALVFPLLGLWLNVTIPFPVYLQIGGVYILTILNAAVLLLPNFTHPLARRVTWLAQCVMFPFSVYFFAVFLPFFPLTPLAMMMMGAGILMYAPLLLFFLHGFRLYDGFRVEAAGGKTWRALILGVAAVLAWPAIYTAQTLHDRATLHAALDYLQYPDYAKNGRFPGNIGALRSSLTHLQAFKEGYYLPYLSEYYNRLAFDNLVLPQAQIDQLATTFLGEPLPKRELPRAAFDDIFWGGGWGGRPRNVTEVINGTDGPRPTTNAVIDSLTSSTTNSEGMARTVAVITVRNPADAVTEFATDIVLPPGVMISNMWLTIEKERVPGKIFEKRAAMWVYQKITEARQVRDPAILRYTGPNVAELKVYPVESNAPRVVEVEFLYPEGAAGHVRIGEKDVALASDPPSAPTLGSASDGNVAIFIPEQDADRLPKVTRQPYLHFLVDASQNSVFKNPKTLREGLERAAATFPGVRDARISFVNFETRDVNEGRLMPLDELLRLPDDKLAPAAFRGGFLGFRAMKEILWQQHLALATSPEAQTRFPYLILMPTPLFTTKGQPAPPAAETAGNLPEFARLLPDNPSYRVYHGDANLDVNPLDPRIPAGPDQPVRILKIASEVFAAPARGAVSHLSVNPVKPPYDIAALDPATGGFVRKLAAPASNPAYARVVAPWTLELGRIFEPSTHRKDALDALLKLCRETGVLVPSAAYMVVENTAQWKMLKRTENKAMKGHEAMAMTETSTPEPGTTMLVLIGLAALYFTQQTRHRPRPA